MAIKTIVVMGDPLQKEGIAAAVITPGMMIDYDTSGNLILHAGAAGVGALMVAIENSLEGEEIGDTYAVGDVTQFVHLRPGDEFMALIVDGEDIAIGDNLSSKGTGYFQEGDTNPKAVALEARNMTSSILGAGRVRAVAM
jgi:hypothetical protein